MAYSFRRGVRAMTVTSATTAAAFFANLLSPIMPIRAFGVFAGTLVPINFFLVVFMMPSAVIIYENHFKYKKFCCCVAKRNKDGSLADDRTDETVSCVRILNFFDSVWSPIIQKYSCLIILLSVVWFGVAAYFAM
jgi:predicted RND superfamily exporter protein